LPDIPILNPKSLQAIITWRLFFIPCLLMKPCGSKNLFTPMNPRGFSRACLAIVCSGGDFTPSVSIQKTFVF